NYLADPDPDFVAAFAQTNAGDMSPNLDGRPGHGPTAPSFPPPPTPPRPPRARPVRAYSVAPRPVSAGAHLF
ncbi:hypothetical protein, partial [Nocardia carnea]|uniref:hypothetical protein n=1 Tax=Nocardia carnea TaxID=37328 RepID=UPI002454A54B